MTDNNDETKPSISLATQEIHPEQNTSRREFLRRLATGGGLAIGAGGVIAYIVNQRNTTVVVLPNGEQVKVRSAEDGQDELANLVTRTVALERALSDSDAERRSLADQLAAAQAEIDTMSQQRDGLLSLVGLYEALEEIGLDGIIDAGLALLESPLEAARNLVGLLESGIAIGLGALADLAEAIPSPQEGLIWLKGEVSALLINLDALKDRIEDVIEPIEPFTTLVINFILDVLNKLPFGLGNPARGGLETIQSIVTGLPLLADGVTSDVLDPLDTMFSQDNRTNLTGTLINPLQDDLIDPAGNTVEALNTLDQTYQNELMAPVQSALGERAAIRTQIEEQRAQLRGVLLANRSGDQRKA